MSRPAPARYASVDPLSRRRDGAQVVDRCVGIHSPLFRIQFCSSVESMIDGVRSGAFQSGLTDGQHRRTGDDGGTGFMVISWASGSNGAEMVVER
jgi:hypothetical protein